jgi:hypothetical protein
LKNGVTVNFLTSKNDIVEKSENTIHEVKKNYELYETKVNKFKRYENYLWIILLLMFLLPNFFSSILKGCFLIVLLLRYFLKLNKIPEKTIEKKKFTYKLSEFYETYSEFYNKNFNLYIYKENTLLHSKIFIINNSIAYLGSTNFTYKAFRLNYETRIKITDKREIEELLLKRFEELKENSIKVNYFNDNLINDLKNYENSAKKNSKKK